MSERLGPAEPVSRGTGTGIAEPPCGKDEDFTIPDSPVRKPDCEARGHILDFSLTYDFYTRGMTCKHQSVNYIGSPVRLGKSAVSPLYDTMHAETVKPVKQSLWREGEKSGLHEIRVAAHMLGKIVPTLDIGQIAAPLPSYHHFPGRPGHLLKQSHLRIRTGINQGLGSIVRSHQSGGAAPDHYNITFHRENKKGKA